MRFSLLNFNQENMKSCPLVSIHKGRCPLRNHTETEWFKIYEPSFGVLDYHRWVVIKKKKKKCGYDYDYCVVDDDDDNMWSGLAYCIVFHPAVILFSWLYFYDFLSTQHVFPRRQVLRDETYCEDYPYLFSFSCRCRDPQCVQVWFQGYIFSTQSAHHWTLSMSL